MLTEIEKYNLPPTHFRVKTTATVYHVEALFNLNRVKEWVKGISDINPLPGIENSPPGGCSRQFDFSRTKSSLTALNTEVNMILNADLESVLNSYQLVKLMILLKKMSKMRQKVDNLE